MTSEEPALSEAKGLSLPAQAGMTARQGFFINPLSLFSFGGRMAQSAAPQGSLLQQYEKHRNQD